MNKRILQWLWGALGVAIAVILDSFVLHIGEFGFPEIAVMLIASTIPVITKGIRNWVLENAQLP